MILAKSGDSRFVDRIQIGAFHGIVHSTFSRTLNILCTDSEDLYTVACRNLDNAPNTLIAGFENLSSFEIVIGDRVYSSTNLLQIGHRLTVSTVNAEKWRCTLSEYPKNSEKLIANLSIMKQYIDNFGKGGGMIKAHWPQNSFEEEVTRLLQERSEAFLCELNANRRENALQVAQSLLGLGPGLTPSGDDFLVGLFAVMNLKGCPLQAYSYLCHEILSKAHQYTNEISLASLKQAACGHVRDSIANLINTLGYGTPEQLLSSLTTVLGIGSSSGTDIAMGIYSGMRFCCQYE